MLLSNRTSGRSKNQGRNHCGPAFRSNAIAFESTANPRILRSDSRTSAVEQEGYDGADQEDHKQNLRNARGTRRDASKTEQSSNQGNNKKYNGVMKHERYLVNGKCVNTRVAIRRAAVA
jgi:hypothetical protein